MIPLADWRNMKIATALILVSLPGLARKYPELPEYDRLAVHARKHLLYKEGIAGFKRFQLETVGNAGIVFVKWTDAEEYPTHFLNQESSNQSWKRFDSLEPEKAVQEEDISPVNIPSARNFFGALEDLKQLHDKPTEHVGIAIMRNPNWDDDLINEYISNFLGPAFAELIQE